MREPAMHDRTLADHGLLGDIREDIGSGVTNLDGRPDVPDHLNQDRSPDQGDQPHKRLRDQTRRAGRRRVFSDNEEEDPSETKILRRPGRRAIAPACVRFDSTSGQGDEA